jgi:hypothetical protein
MKKPRRGRVQLAYPDAPDPKDREATEEYAGENGFFWLECPRCGRMFGGHEWRRDGRYAVACFRDPTVGHPACCLGRNDRAACSRFHARYA